jgi:hypothetical protein
MLRPVLIAGVMLGLMSIIDTLAYGVRTSGVLTRRLAISMTLFNILMILSRLSNMFQAPILGNFPDKVYQGTYQPEQVLAALRIDLLFVISGVVAGAMLMPTMIKLFTRGIMILEEQGSLPRTLFYGLRRIVRLPHYLAPPGWRHLRKYSDFRVLPYQFLIYNVFVTCFYSIGVMSTVLAASLDHTVAATAMTLSGIVNGIATLTLFMIVDPPGAVVVENCISGKRPVGHAKTMNVTLVLTRLMGTLLALVLLPPMSQYVLSVAHWVDNYFGGNRSVTLASANAAAGGLDYEFLLKHQPSGSYTWVLRAHNNTDQSITLNYASAQAFDFVVRQDGVALWRASAGMRYTQALVSEELLPHQTKVYTATWDGMTEGGGRAAGKVQAEAQHLLTPDPSSIALDVSLPAR